MSSSPARCLLSAASVGAFLLTAFAVGAALRAEDAAPAPEASFFNIRAKDGWFDLHAARAPLGDILRDLEAKSGVAFEVDERLGGQRVTLNVENADVESLLAELTASQAFLYERTADGYRLALAAVTSQQEELPVEPAVVEPKSPPAERSAEEDTALDRRGALTNTRRTVRELIQRGARTLLLQNAYIDTEAAAASGVSVPVPERFQAADDTEFYIVQFDHSVSAQDRTALEQAGASISHYVPNSAYAVRVTPAGIAALRAIPGVCFIEPYHPYYKMSGEVLAYLAGRADPAAESAVTGGVFNVLSFKGAETAPALKQAGVEIVRSRSVGGRELLTVRADPGLLEKVIGQDGVQWVEPRRAMQPMNDLGTKRIRAASLRALHPTLQGDGVVIGVTDTGVDFGNRGFAADPSLPTSTNLNTRIAYYEAREGGFTSDGLPGDAHGHGTHVSGSILGNGAHSETVIASPGSAGPPYSTNQFAGSAPGARLVMLEDFNSFTDEEQTGISYSKGARLSNNSWGNSLYEYGTASMTWDALVRDADGSSGNGNQEYTAFFAAGNAGAGDFDGTEGVPNTVGEPGNAKNVITVGALEQLRFARNIMDVYFGSDPTPYSSDRRTDSDWQVAKFSSRGPVTTTDLRVKPDIVAPGSYVLSIQSHEINPDEYPDVIFSDYRYENVDSGTNFAFFNGTSMATPLACGAGALAFQYFTNAFFKAPSPAMMKAMLVGGARNVNSMVYRHPPYDEDLEIVDEGWGVVDVVRTVDGPRSRPTDQVVLLDQDDTTPLDTGNSYSHQVSVGQNEGGLKIALAWTDQPGTPGNGVQLVNNLDLIVFPPGGGVYLGNQFAGDGVHTYRYEALYADYLYDGFNNVETVVIPPGLTGTFTVRVYGREVADGPQDFALAILKGIGFQGRTDGNEPSIAITTNDEVVLAFSHDDYQVGGYSNLERQIFVKKWVGPVGDVHELGEWRRMEDQWAPIRDSMLSGAGISRTLENSRHPSVALDGDNVYVAWQEDPQNFSSTNFSRIFLRAYKGSSWIELANSGRRLGLSGNTNGNATAPVAAVMGDHQPVVAWKHETASSGDRILLAKWNGTNAWVGLSGSHTNSGIPWVGGFRSASDPTMCINELGNPVVAWRDEFDPKQIIVRRWNGSSWDSINPPASAPIIAAPRISSGADGTLYLTWVQTFGSNPLPYDSYQVYALRYTGGSWSQMGGSATFPGVSAAPYLADDGQQPHAPAIFPAFNGDVFVAWRAGQDPTYILVRKWELGATNWVGLGGSGGVPGIQLNPSAYGDPELAVDGVGLPVVAFVNSEAAAPVENKTEVQTYTLVGDRSPPSFAGLQSAIGGTNGDVTLTWLPAVDNVSSTLYYRIYRGTQTWDCGEIPACSIEDVFGHPVQVVTNLTTCKVTGLTNGRTYCFGVRALDGSDLEDENTVTRSAGPVTGAGDTDGDCLSNAVEIAVSTEPCNPDTDGDGMWDGWEWFYSTNNPGHAGSLALDPLDNGTLHVRTGAPGDPLQDPDADPDGDGAGSIEEYQWYLAYTGVCVTATASLVSPDPTAPDTDGDGMPDGWEMVNGLNPVVAADAAGDADCDGLTNLLEYQNGSDPNTPDSDSDGLNDGPEVSAGTDPALPDTDLDGLDDGADPLPKIADSNTNLVSDADMIELGHTNPTASVQAYNILCQENFETSSRTNWTHRAVNPALPIDLWHLSLADPDPNASGIVYLHERSTSTAYRLAYDVALGTNVNADYNRGMALRDALESPRCDASAVSTLFVMWNEYYSTEPNGDFVQVFARGGSNTNWFPVTGALSGKSGVLNPDSAEPPRWTHRVVNLQDFAGYSNVQVRFLFLANTINNEFPGWYVDDVVIFEAAYVYGWVRDNNGAAVQGARVIATGQGGITNVIGGHRVVRPGKIFGESFTLEDGSYFVVGLPQGRYYVQALESAHRAEFYDGPLYAGVYAFGAGFNPGVYDRDQVALGRVDLTAPGAVTNCDFELERGAGRTYLGVMLPNPAGVTYDVFVDGLSSNLRARVWDGVADSNKALNAFSIYTTATNLTLENNHPDWLLNAVRPALLGDLAFGEHVIQAGTNMSLYPLSVTDLREGEATLVKLSTNQAKGYLLVRAEDGMAYPVSIDGRPVTNRTPARVPVKAGLHEVLLAVTNAPLIAPKFVTVPLGDRAVVEFATNETGGATGYTLVTSVDNNGNVVSGAQIFVNGRLMPDPAPAIVQDLRPGTHRVALRRDGYRPSEVRSLFVNGGVTNSTQFTLYSADEDYDGVGDAIEILGYTNLYRFHRFDDPDLDGLNNLFEFEQFRAFNVRMNPFNADTDGDAMGDGAELRYDGISNLLARSAIETNAVQDAAVVRSLFVGQYLSGVDHFGTNAAAVECDRFVPGNLHRTNEPMPNVAQAVTVFGGIPAFPADLAVTEGHNKSAEILADGMPDRVDTDGDGMWDGFEYEFGLGTVARLDVIECGRGDEDADYDGINNYDEFLGPDFTPNTTDWSDPTRSDSDDDGITDGWEYFYGYDPNDPDDAFLDEDGDGLVNLSEYYAGTNPKLADTDADFIPDFEEVVVYGSDPLDLDTDDDGLWDGREVFDKDLDGVQDGGFFPSWAGGDLDGDGQTDGPTDWDTDGDGMPDGFEVIDVFGNLRNDPRLDPYNPFDGDDDPDGDGLSNLQEYLVRDTMYGFNPSGVVWDYSTDPFDPDSDGDGLPDGWEVIKGLHPMDPIPIGFYNPQAPGGSGGPDDSYIVTPDGVMVRRYELLGPKGDPDSDGLWNGREYGIRFLLDAASDTNAIDSLSTDPWNSDTDGDGLRDGEEDRAFRSNPIVEDADEDRLTDGCSVPDRWGEVETGFRLVDDYAFVNCTNCTWLEAYALAQVSHPTNNGIIGHLATPSTAEEQILVSGLLSNATNIAIGGWNMMGTNANEWAWITGALFFYTNWAAGQPSLLETGFPHYIAMNGLGEWSAITTQAVDHYVIEWEQVLPTTTNHFDLALNDLWKLVWPSSADLPRWERVKPATTSLRPAPRWGPALAYVPVFETKDPKNDNTGTILLDNRQLVVIGGRDGVTRHKDIWEYQFRSNIWHLSTSRLTDLLASLPEGISEGSAITVFGYKNTKSSDCGCEDWQPYDCNGENFLEPKNRPWSSSPSFEWTMLFGGWDESNNYKYITRFYKSTDDPEVTEKLYCENDGTEYIQIKTTREGTNAPTITTNILVDSEGGEGLPRRILGGPLVRTRTTVQGTTTTTTEDRYLGTNWFYFTGLNGLGNACQTLGKAFLEIPTAFATVAPLEIAIFAEFDLEADMTQYDPQSGTAPSDRFTSRGWFFNSSTLFTNIPAGLPAGGVATVDVSSIVFETIAHPSFDHEEMGFIIRTPNLTGTVVQVPEKSVRLNVTYRPSYSVDPYWMLPERIEWTYTTRKLENRKSTAMVYDYNRDRIVIFGGLDGLDVLDDTH